MRNPLRASPHPHLLEIPVRPWLRELSERAGRPLTLAEVPREPLERIARRGFHAVWLMGVWRTGTAGRRRALQEPALRRAYDLALPGWRPRDVEGSPYSIEAYEPSEALGGREGLARLRERLAALGVGVVLDFVPNHVGLDHPWLDEHPEFLVQGTPEDLAREPGAWFAHRDSEGLERILAHGRDPHFPAWSDTCQVDHRRGRARDALRDVLVELSSLCDGVRCDVAMLLLEEVFRSTWGEHPGGRPGEFWAEAIGRLRQVAPETVLIAESYGGFGRKLRALGFDFAYDKDLTDELLASDIEGLRDRLLEGSEEKGGCVHFLENHDEERALSAFGPERLQAAAVLAYGLPGMRFFQEGQIEGRRVHLPVQLGRFPEEKSPSACSAFYERLLDTLSRELFHAGRWRPLVGAAVGPGEPPPRALLGSFWSHRGDVAALLANLSSEPLRGRWRLPLERDRAARLPFRDALSGARFTWSLREARERGIVTTLGPYEARILVHPPNGPA